MLKTILFGITCSAVTFATIVYTGTTVHSSPFQMDIPYGAAIKMTPDPANVWSWHQDFHNVSGGAPGTANVLVDFDGNGVMDTENSWLRVLVTDLEIVSRSGANASATISDGTGKRYSVGVANSAIVGHVSLATPIVLPVGAQLQVTVDNGNIGGPFDFEVNLIGRVVNL